MKEKKIVKTVVNSTSSVSNGNTFIVSASAIRGAVEPLIVLASAFAQTKSKAYLIGETAKWEKLLAAVNNDKSNVIFEHITLVNNIAEISLAEGNVFFFPLKNNASQATNVQIINALNAANSKDGEIFVLGKNTNKKSSVTNRFFGFMANAWARILHGINAANIASEIVGFTIQKYNELIEKYGDHSAMYLIKQAKEEGEEITEVSGNLGEPVYGFGAGFAAIVSAKLLVFKTLTQRFFQLPLKDIKTNGIQLTNANGGFYKLSFFFAAVIAFLGLLITATDFNVTWDEPGHVEYGEDILSYHSSLGSDTTLFDFSKRKSYAENFLLYGASVDTFAAAIHKVTGGNIYIVRRYVMACLSFLLLLVIGLIAKHFFGWRAALLALIAAYFSPSFHGHFFNNHKDIPFALGYAMTAYYLILVIKNLPKPKFQDCFMLAVGIGFSMSIRASGIAQFAFVMLFFGLHWLSSKEKGKTFLKYVVLGFSIIIPAYIIGIALWPLALRSPFTGPLDAFKEFSNFSALHYMELFDGVRIKDKPWFYEPKLILLTAPLMIIIGWALAALTSIIKPNKTRTMGLMILLVMALLPSGYAIYKNSYVYNGWRHFIFIYPLLIVLAVWGWEKLIELFGKVNFAKIAIPIIALALLVPAMAFQFRNHPYQYMYFNELAGGIKGANGNYDLDYWNQTPKEAMKWLLKHDPKVGQGKALVSSNNIKETLTAQVEGADSLWYNWVRELEWQKRPHDYAIFTTRTLSKSQILGGFWPPKGTIHEIKIDGVTVAAVIKNPTKEASYGLDSLQANKIGAAKALFQKALKANPLEEEAIRGLAQCFKIEGNFDTAIVLFKEAEKVRDHNYESSFGIGESYFNKAMSTQNMEDLDKAKKYFAQTLEYKSNYSTANYYLGVIAQNQRNDYEAITYFQRFTAMNPNYPQVYQLMSQSYSNIGKQDSAQYFMQVFNYLNNGGR